MIALNGGDPSMDDGALNSKGEPRKIGKGGIHELECLLAEEI